MTKSILILALSVAFIVIVITDTTRKIKEGKKRQ